MMHLRSFTRLAYPLFGLLAAAIVVACGSDHASTARATKTAVSSSKAEDQLLPVYGNPVLLDSDYVMYPLPLGENVTEETGSYDRSYSRAATYWNMLFYNPQTASLHLLDENRKMLIQSYHGHNAPGSASPDDALTTETAHSPTSQLLYFLVNTVDYNHDGHLSSDDPSYLFISLPSGQGFKQISPDSLHVTSWEIQERTGKILLQTLRDSNHNRKFDSDDEVIPYVYDALTGQPARPVITPQFVQALKLKYQQQWPQPTK